MEQMKLALVEIHASGWRLLPEENPAYLEEFLSVSEQNSAASPPKNSFLKMFTDAVKIFLPFVGRMPMIFLGERCIALHVRNLFGLRAEDFHVLDNERGELDVEHLPEILQRGAIHVMFTDAYDELKPLLEQLGLREGADFIDGRGLLVAVMN